MQFDNKIWPEKTESDREGGWVGGGGGRSGGRKGEGGGRRGEEERESCNSWH